MQHPINSEEMTSDLGRWSEEKEDMECEQEGWKSGLLEDRTSLMKPEAVFAAALSVACADPTMKACIAK